MFKNVTLKLTLSYLLVVMIISILFSFIVYRIGSANLTFGLDVQSQELSTTFPIFNGTPFATPNPQSIEAGKRNLINELIVTNLFVLVGAGFICYLLAKETIKPIEKAHEQQKNFTADVSHELRTPLTALKMESEVALMDDTMTKEDLLRVVSSNIEEASKLEVLINNLLRLSKLEAGELQSEFSVVSLKNIAETAINQVQATANNKKVKLTLETTGNYSIKADKDSLIQMLVIFLDNAIKYSSSKTAVNICIDKSPKTTSIEIIDHGRGIKEEDLVHVFDRFYRANNARVGTGGFGLGLSIAKLIADLHQANITISSQLKHGTTVKVDFTN